MAYWGKLVGSVAGFAMGGPLGAVVGAALGHAADQDGTPKLAAGLRQRLAEGLQGSPLGPARVAALLGRRDQLFAIGVVVLSAKLAKCDGVVNRAEIDAFKRQFRMPPDSVREVGRMFDQARDSAESFEPYARQLGESFADNRGMLEDVLTALFNIARADGSPNAREMEFLTRTHALFGLDRLAWDRARQGASRAAAAEMPDAYAVLGVPASASNDEIRQAWKRLMRENHPDSLAARGVPAEFVARATDKVALINAAWDRVKRERGL